MKKFFALSLAIYGLALASAAFADFEDTGNADLEAVYQDTAAFDGGPGSTINVSPAEVDAANS